MKTSKKKNILQMAPAPAPAPTPTLPVEPALALVPFTASEISLLGVCLREYKEGTLPAIMRNTNLKDTERLNLDCSLISQKLKYYFAQIREQSQKKEGV